MKKYSWMGLLLGFLLVMVGLPVTANAQKLMTEVVIKQTYIRKDAKKHAIWNIDHTAVVGNLQNYPKTTWYVDKLTTLKKHSKNVIYAQIKSADGRHQGLVWHGYLKLGNYFDDYAQRYHKQAIIDGFNRRVVSGRNASISWDHYFGNYDKNWVTIISPKLNQITNKFMEHLTKKDYKNWDRRQKDPMYDRTNPLTNQTFGLSGAYQLRYQKKYHLDTIDIHQFGRVDLKGHLTQNQVVQSLSKQIIRTNNLLYFGAANQEILYTGAAVRIDQKRHLLYMMSIVAYNSEDDMSVHSALK